MAKGWGDAWRSWTPPHGERPTVPPVVRRTPRVRRPDVAREAMAFQCRCLKLPEPVAEFRFHETRKWKFDLAWPDQKVALEQEGIVYPKATGDHRLSGRHVSVSGFKGDIEKYGEAFRLGWRVLRCLPAQVTDGTAMLWLEPVLRRKETR